MECEAIENNIRKMKQVIIKIKNSCESFEIISLCQVWT